MSVNGGVMKELSISHPTAGTKLFYGIKDEDSTYILGGYTQENTVAANGVLVSNMQPKMGSFQCTCYSDMSETMAAFEYLQECMNSPEEFTATFANANTIVYSGAGKVEGDVELSGNKMTIQFKVVSGLGFTKQ